MNFQEIHIPTSGLNAYPKSGDTFQFRFYATSGADVMRMDFGYQDANNRYTIEYRSDNYGFYIYEMANGSGTKLDSVSNPTYPTNEWLKMVISWGLDGLITENRGESLALQRGEDVNSGGIGIGHDHHNSNSSTMYFDKMEIL
jgi:hypothetical protein